ncbi:hypothetical protein [Sinorhizobium sp. GL28]|uniref:hypothetical protein n=1 Tax=Sinorhizobium sp. GL28 TaxID=1358418 RepID=UPI00071C3B48|nr:hypothetical protein [Sinorhizobium sp. GL28]KSV92133.1 hypothetical protein N184_24050 [Sinorhizobium sp. GL28]
MAQIFGATISMLLLGTLIGWLLRKVSALSVLSSRLAGLVVLAFVAPAIYAFNSGRPYSEMFILCGIAALVAAVVFYFLKPKQQNA